MECREFIPLFFYGSLFTHQFALIIEFSFTDMGTVAEMGFPGGAVGGQSGFCGFVMCSALGASLLTMSAFRIWHKSNFIYRDQLSKFLNFSNPFQIGFSDSVFSFFTASLLFRMEAAVLSQCGPSICSNSQVLCMGMLRLMNS